ncbi:hypothetical protein ACFL2Q_12410 [Thermodesulfobacteriota bacterium]
MIVAVRVSLKKIVDMARDFPWPRPVVCGECGGDRLWGHGYVMAYFDEIDQPVLLKRYRCPDCKGVFRLRPAGYFKRFRATVQTIRAGIASRLETGKWPPGISRCRAGHWLRYLKQKTMAHLGGEWIGLMLVEAFDRLISKAKIPPSSSFKAVFRAGETYPTEDCRCFAFPVEIGPAPSGNKEARPCTTTKSNRLQPSDSESSTTWWVTWIWSLETKTG